LAPWYSLPLRLAVRICGFTRRHETSGGDVAKEAWGKVDVKGQIAAARELQAGDLVRQQAALAAAAANNRELLILQIAYGSSMQESFGVALKA
jgi:hypothetical protein